MKRLPLALAAALLVAAPALACDKVARTVEFLGWAAEGQLFAWRVHETCVGCSPKWVMERAFVSTVNGRVTEYVTRWEKTPYPRPELPGLPEFEAWQKRYPLTKATGTAAVVATQKGVTLKPNRQQELCAKGQGELVLSLGKATRTWAAPSALCGCVRAYPNPTGAAVAFLTGPVKRTCDDCHGAACCGAVEGFALYAE